MPDGARGELISARPSQIQAQVQKKGGGRLQNFNFIFSCLQKIAPESKYFLAKPWVKDKLENFINFTEIFFEMTRTSIVDFLIQIALFVSFQNLFLRLDHVYCTIFPKLFLWLYWSPSVFSNNAKDKKCWSPYFPASSQWFTLFFKKKLNNSSTSQKS